MKHTRKNKYIAIEQLRRERKQGKANIANLEEQVSNINKALGVTIQEIGKVRMSCDSISLLLDIWQRRLEAQKKGPDYQRS